MTHSTVTVMALLVPIMFILQASFWWSAVSGQHQQQVSRCQQCKQNPQACRRIAGLYTVAVLTQGSFNPVVDIPPRACDINITELAPSENYLAVRTEEGNNIVNGFWTDGGEGRFRGVGTIFEHRKGTENCPGECITAPGPTNRRITVQLLYKAKNPGIAYSFALPTEVPFQLFQSAGANQQATSAAHSARDESPASLGNEPGAELAPEPYASARRANVLTSQLEEPRGPSVYGQQRPRVGSFSERNTPERTPTSDQVNYVGSSYGSHTLGGRGLSYSYYAGDNNDENVDDDDDDNDDDNRLSPVVGRRRNTGRRYPFPDAVSSRGSSNTLHTDRRAPPGTYVSGANVYQRSKSNRRYPNRKQQKPSSRSQATYNANNIHRDRTRGFRISASSSRSGPVERTYSRGVAVGSRVEGIERPIEQRPAVNVGSRPLGNRYEWVISGLSQCSRTCGGGFQQAELACVLSSRGNQVVVASDNCQNAIRPSVKRVSCNSEPCPPSWVADDWSECSATCGGGTQTRTVECRQRFSAGLEVSMSDSQCGQGEAKPPASQLCNENACSRGWTTADWGPCSASCGGGQKVRKIQCSNEQGVPVSEDFCSSKDRPATSEQCNAHPCQAQSQWWHTLWSEQCAETCSAGVTTRHVMCADKSGQPLSDDQCQSDQRPADREQCQGREGCGAAWFTGPWSQCSSNCGQGVKIRQVICVRVAEESADGRLVIKTLSDEHCVKDSKPSEEEQCSNPACGSQYFATAWSQCSVTCGNGVRTREIRCLDESLQPSLSCDASKAPLGGEACQMAPCFSHAQESKVKSSSQSRLQEAVENKRDDNSNYFDNYNRYRNYNRYSNHVGGERPDVARRERLSGDSIKSDSDCKNTYWNCRIVVQARMCSYSYYRHVCCAACQKSSNDF